MRVFKASICPLCFLVILTKCEVMEAFKLLRFSLIMLETNAFIFLYTSTEKGSELLISENF